MSYRQGARRCPRCGEGRLVGWNELNEEEREVANRLPAAADYSAAERRATHRWCTNCWHEETEGAASNA
ncbi:MAG TPA: hypothetical protein VEV81_16335 [Pyrinomonadaceae bacterium]|nr:hypothetical protein [Pyrinomonadaceae bacterium]